MLGPLEQYMTPTLDVVLLYSSRAGSDLGNFFLTLHAARIFFSFEPNYSFSYLAKFFFGTIVFFGQKEIRQHLDWNHHPPRCIRVHKPTGPQCTPEGRNCFHHFKNLFFDHIVVRHIIKILSSYILNYYLF